MGVDAGLCMCDVVKKFTFAISSPDEFLLMSSDINLLSHDINCTTKRSAQRCRKRIVGPLIRRVFLTKSKKNNETSILKNFIVSFATLKLFFVDSKHDE